MTPWCHRRLGALIAVLVCLLACDQRPTRPHSSLDATLEDLRTQFNADVDRARVLMIVAPT